MLSKILSAIQILKEFISKMSYNEPLEAELQLVENEQVYFIDCLIRIFPTENKFVHSVNLSCQCNIPTVQAVALLYWYTAFTVLSVLCYLCHFSSSFLRCRIHHKISKLQANLKLPMQHYKTMQAVLLHSTDLWSGISHYAVAQVLNSIYGYIII